MLFDARSQDALRTVRRLRSQRVPLLARINGSFLLSPAKSAGCEPVPAYQLMLAVRELRHPVALSGTCRDGARPAGARLRLVSSLQVRFPGAAHRGWPPERQMQLFGVGLRAPPGPASCD